MLRGETIIIIFNYLDEDDDEDDDGDDNDEDDDDEASVINLAAVSVERWEFYVEKVANMSYVSDADENSEHLYDDKWL